MLELTQGLISRLRLVAVLISKRKKERKMQCQQTNKDAIHQTKQANKDAVHQTKQANKDVFVLIGTRILF